MRMRFLALSPVLLYAIPFIASASKHNLTESFAVVPLDHFDVSNTQTFRLRYLVDKTLFTDPLRRPPLIAYTGNEGSIDDFAANTGAMWSLAERSGGLVVFIEERYYGKSIPPPSSPANPYQYLSHAQILADYVLVISLLQKIYYSYLPSDDVPSPPVVAVGGSYGGMLAAYLQRQHPKLITVAWASSAPVVGYAATLEAQNRSADFYRITEANYPPGCQAAVKEGFMVHPSPMCVAMQSGVTSDVE